MRAPIWTRSFTLATLSTTAIFLGFYFLIPVLPIFAASLGATHAGIGLVVAVYSLSAVFARLVLGSRMDRHGRKPFLLLGLIIFGIAAALYPACGPFASLIALRLLHGMGWGLITTSVATLASDLAPADRRGEAIGYWGLAPTIAMAIGPLAGAALFAAGGYPAVFHSSAALALAALLLAVPIVEPLRQSFAETLREATRPQEARAAQPATLAAAPRSAYLPAIVLYLSSLSYGSIVAFVPIEFQGHPGASSAFFSLYAVTILFARPLAGRFSDRIGRAAIINPGLALGAAGTVALGFAGAEKSDFLLGLAAVLYGLGIGGGAFPGLMSLTVDRCPLPQRAAALGIFFTAYDIAIASGSALLGPVYDRFGFLTMNLVAATAIVASLIVLMTASKGESKP